MQDYKDSIFILDLHNTLYDEVLEYGGAMQAAIDYLFEQAHAQHIPLDQDILYTEIAKAHAQLGSDWDDEVWDHLPCLQQFKNLPKIKADVIRIRLEVSEHLTKKYAYQDTLQTLADIKKEGARVYLATEATANAAANAVRWLGMDGIIDAVYSWPFAKPYRALEHTAQFFFPAQAGVYLQKPHPSILTCILLDVMKADGQIPQEIELGDIISTVKDETIDVAALIDKASDKNSVQIRDAINAIQTRLEFKETLYKPILEAYWHRCFYIGDSFFKDGFLARNANVPFIHAAYGKNVDDAIAFQQAKDVLYHVTGWNPFLLQLTQEAGKLPELTALIKPQVVCQISLRSFMQKI